MDRLSQAQAPSNPLKRVWLGAGSGRKRWACLGRPGCHRLTQAGPKWNGLGPSLDFWSSCPLMHDCRSRHLANAFNCQQWEIPEGKIMRTKYFVPARALVSLQGRGGERVELPGPFWSGKSDLVHRVWGLLGRKSVRCMRGVQKG